MFLKNLMFHLHLHQKFLMFPKNLFLLHLLL
jgi:hypothetical protein